jgi:hypothetical protein
MYPNCKDFTTAFQLCVRICHQEGPKNRQGLEFSGTHQFLVNANDANLLSEDIDIREKQRSCIIW